MQLFTVPQFIDVEDKIIGPITVRQFIIILAAFLIAVAAYRIFTFTAFLVVALLVFVIAAVFAFYRVNGMPFHFFILNFIKSCNAYDPNDLLPAYLKRKAAKQRRQPAHKPRKQSPARTASIKRAYGKHARLVK